MWFGPEGVWVKMSKLHGHPKEYTCEDEDGVDQSWPIPWKSHPTQTHRKVIDRRAFLAEVDKERNLDEAIRQLRMQIQKRDDADEIGDEPDADVEAIIGEDGAETMKMAEPVWLRYTGAEGVSATASK